MKKMLFFVFGLIILVLATSCAKETTTGPIRSSDYSYILLEDGSAEITSYYGDYRADIPSILDRHTVTSIGNEAFSRCFDLLSVSIPNSITSIGNEAFYCCHSLSSIPLLSLPLVTIHLWVVRS